ncbi:MAG TPA: carboxypeptidase-like regulatory domain-containing protein, partial [Gemmatimonadaceae bacterium]|nr:carboxypeptidase-like regulatory domain-containing protein [Gemmatimonadaceae bacterium]
MRFPYVEMPSARPHLALLLLAMLAIVPGAVRAQQVDTANTATLTGLVRDSTGAPIAHVEIILPALSRGTYSDAAGWFTLAAVPPGQYEVRFERLGYQRITTRWRAEAGARTEVAVMLHALAHTLATVEVTGKAPPRARGASTVLGSVVDSAGDPL